MNKIKLLTLILLFIAPSVNFAKEPGDKVSDFTIKNYDGKTYTLSQNKDAKATIVVFWSAQCPFVQAYNERMPEIVNTYQQKGFVFWAINSNKTESAQDVESHAKSHNYPFPVLKDKNNVVADLFEATRTPEVFVIDKDNVILYHGRIDDNKDASEVTTRDLMNALNEINDGKSVTVKSTKQFGCTIKR
jgi:peroxiredoxin